MYDYEDSYDFVNLLHNKQKKEAQLVTAPLISQDGAAGFNIPTVFTGLTVLTRNHNAGASTVSNH